MHMSYARYFIYLYKKQIQIQVRTDMKIKGLVYTQAFTQVCLRVHIQTHTHTHKASKERRREGNMKCQTDSSPFKYLHC